MFPRNPKPTGSIDRPNFRPQLIPCPVSGSLERTQVRSSGPRQRSGRSSELKQRNGRSSRPSSAQAPSSREWFARANTKFARANASELHSVHPESGSLERTLQKTQSGFLQRSLFFIPFSIHYHNHLQ